jgi:hypothetical protein
MEKAMNPMMGNDRHAHKPLLWTSADKPVADALSRAGDLHSRWGEAQALAREAQERVAQAARDGQRERAEALAAGKPDPGPPDLSVVEAEAAAAADQALALGDGYVLARAAALDLADQRAESWQRAAERQLEPATTKLLDSLDAAAALHDDWLAARQQVLLAASAEMRRRTSPKLAVARITAPLPKDPTIASLLAVTRATIVARSADDAHIGAEAERAAVS